MFEILKKETFQFLLAAKVPSFSLKERTFNLNKAQEKIHQAGKESMYYGNLSEYHQKESRAVCVPTYIRRMNLLEYQNEHNSIYHYYNDIYQKTREVVLDLHKEYDSAKKEIDGFFSIPIVSAPDMNDTENASSFLESSKIHKKG